MVELRAFAVLEDAEVLLIAEQICFTELRTVLEADADGNGFRHLARISRILREGVDLHAVFFFRLFDQCLIYVEEVRLILFQLFLCEEGPKVEELVIVGVTVQMKIQ